MTIVTSRRERKKLAARAQILTTAIDLFSRRGMAEVTVDEIAEAADVGKGTIYNYFQTKEDIVVAFMAGVEARVQAKLGRFTASKRSLDSILSEFIEFQFRLKKRYHPFVKVFLAQMFLGTDQLLPYMVEMQKVVDPTLEALFLGLQKRGLIPADIDRGQLTMTFKTMHLGMTCLWAVEGPPFRQTSQVVKQQMKFFCEGIGRKS